MARWRGVRWELRIYDRTLKNFVPDLTQEFV
jgi:hypothetical protein